MWKRITSGLTKYVQQVSSFDYPKRVQLYSFVSSTDIAKWEVFTDEEYGGCSTASLEQLPEGETGAKFHGELSKDIERRGNARKLRRSGFCGMRTLPADDFLDLEPYEELVFRVRGDGRPYIASLRTENWSSYPGSPPDIWQAFVFAPPGEWTDVHVDMKRFLLTWRGRVVQQPREMSKKRILSLGLSVGVAGKQETETQKPGPFQLDIESIRAQIKGATEADEEVY